MKMPLARSFTIARGLIVPQKFSASEPFPSLSKRLEKHQKAWRWRKPDVCANGCEVKFLKCTSSECSAEDLAAHTVFQVAMRSNPKRNFQTFLSRTFTRALSRFDQSSAELLRRRDAENRSLLFPLWSSRGGRRAVTRTQPPLQAGRIKSRQLPIWSGDSLRTQLEEFKGRDVHVSNRVSLHILFRSGLVLPLFHLRPR